jgi:hypothetical protein
MWSIPANRQEVVPFAARWSLFLVLGGLAIRWVRATHHELNLWKQWLDNPAIKGEVYATIVFLSLTLGVCLAYFYNTVLITLIFTAFLLLNYWGQWLSNDHIRRSLLQTRERQKSETHQAVLGVLERYWLQRPQLARITTLMFFSSVAFSIALAGAVQSGPGKQRFQLLASSILTVNILFGEIIIGWWRHRREQDIAQAKQSILVTAPDLMDDDIATASDEGDLKSTSTAAYFGIFAVAIGMAGLGIGTASINNARLSNLVFPFTWDFQDLLFLASILFFLEFLILSFLWIGATRNELRLWIKWLKNPVDRQQVYLAILGLSMVLGTMLAFFYSIVLISAFATLYFLVNYWTQWLANDHFARALRRTREETSGFNAAMEKRLDAMEEYWLKRPQLARITTLMFFSSVAFSLALAGFVQGGPVRYRLYLLSYFVLILSIFIGEIIICMWRRTRDRRIAHAGSVRESTQHA